MKSFPRWLIVASGLAMMALIGGGYWFYLYQEQILRQNSEANLQAIAQLKVNQIAEWRSDQLRDAAAISESPFLTEAVEQWFVNPQSELGQKILSRFRALQDLYGYRDVMLVDRDGQVRLSLSKHIGSLHEDAARSLTEALRERKPVLSDLHVGPGDLPPHIDVVAPLLSETRETKDPVGAVIFQIDARQFLYPLIQFWPTPSRSAETLLVRREGDAVLFLNELRHQQDTALNLRIPLSREDVPAVMAVLGKEGVVQGKDYRGVDVLSVIRAVPNSPWFMVAKVDEAEALAGWRFLSILILALVIGLLAFLVTAVGMVWQKTGKAHYKELFLAEAALRRVEEGHRITLMSVGDGIITTDTDGRVELLNPVAEAVTGWRQEEALGKPLAEVFRIFNEETRQAVENPVSKVLREGLVVGLANHTVIVAQDGTERPIADSAAPVRDERGAITGVVLVFRDQSKERAVQKLLLYEKAQAQQYLDVAGVMLLALDTNGHVILVNRKGCEILGYQEGGVFGKDWFEHFLPDKVRDEVKGVFSRIIAGHLEMDEYVENVVLTSRGEARLIAWHNSVLRDQGGSIIGIVSSGEDITERKRAEEALQESEKRYRELVEKANDIIYLTDVNGHFLVFNAVGLKITGYSQEEIVHKHYLDLIHPDYKEEVDRFYGLQFVKRIPDTYYEAPIISHQGETVWIGQNVQLVMEGDAVVGFQGICRDITDRKRAEDELRASEERLELALRGADLGLWDWNLKTGRAVWNERATAMLGYLPGEVQTNLGTWKSSVHPEDWLHVSEVLNSHLEGRLSFFEAEYRLRCKSGEWKWILGRGKVVEYDKHGKPSRMTGTSLDITDRKRAEEIALQAARLRSVADLSSGVAHHFNNLLQIVIGNTSLSLADLESGDLSEIKTNLEQMLGAATLGAETVKRLQTFANMRADVTEGEGAIFDIAATARNAAEVSRPLWKSDPEKKGIKIDLQLDLEDGCLVKGQENEIFEVLVNLIRNAAEAMPQGGDIEVKTYKEADEVVVTVRDTGIGIAEADLNRVFQPFWSNKGVGIGKGMGLAVTHGLVKRHGGAISVQSAVGKGTTFTIRLPVSQEPVRKTEQPLTSATANHLTILVIDDDLNIATLLQKICAKAGHRVFKTLSGQEGLAIFNKEPVDLVLCDLGMPGMNGWDVGKAIRSICRDRGIIKPPFILLTGWGGQELEREKIAESGTDAVVAKPIDSATVISTVREIADRFNIGSRGI